MSFALLFVCGPSKIEVARTVDASAAIANTMIPSLTGLTLMTLRRSS
jgi:hypothetical protein